MTIAMRATASAVDVFPTDWLCRDNPLVTATFRGQDMVTLVVAVPLLLVGLIFELPVWAALTPLGVLTVALLFANLRRPGDRPTGEASSMNTREFENVTKSYGHDGVNATTGELRHALTVDTDRDYQPRDAKDPNPE